MPFRLLPPVGSRDNMLVMIIAEPLVATAGRRPTATMPTRVAHWGGVLAMSLCVFALIASEFMPVSLLTPIAAALHVSEGLAGQGIAISGAFAVLTSLIISRVSQRCRPQDAAAGADGADGPFRRGRRLAPTTRLTWPDGR